MQHNEHTSNNRQVMLLTSSLEDRIQSRDLAGVERACQDIHLHLRTCAVQGKYAGIAKTLVAVEALLSDCHDLPAQLILLDEFPVSLAGYVKISRSKSDPTLQESLVNNLVKHETIADLRYDSFDTVITQMSKALSGVGCEKSLVKMLDNAYELNQDIVPILFISCFRAMEHQSQIVKAWVRSNYEFFLCPVDLPREFRAKFREWVDFKSYGCPISDEVFIGVGTNSTLWGTDLFYYRETLNEPVPQPILDHVKRLNTQNSESLLAAYAIVYDAQHQYLALYPNELNLEALVKALGHCVAAADQGLIEVTEPLLDRVAQYLDGLLTYLPPHCMSRVVGVLPSAWVVNSQLCRTSALELDLGL
jgi:hypothetical protein